MDLAGFPLASNYPSCDTRFSHSANFICDCRDLQFPDLLLLIIVYLFGAIVKAVCSLNLLIWTLDTSL